MGKAGEHGLHLPCRPPVGLENRDEARLPRDVDAIVRPECKANWAIELARAFAFASEIHEMFSLGRELADDFEAGVQHVDIALRIHSEVHGIPEWRTLFEPKHQIFFQNQFEWISRRR